MVSAGVGSHRSLRQELLRSRVDKRGAVSGNIRGVGSDYSPATRHTDRSAPCTPPRSHSHPMAGSHRRMLVVDFGRLATSGKRPQNGVETSAFERLLLRLHPGAARGRVGRDRFGSSGPRYSQT